MPKTVTMRLDPLVYELFKQVAAGERRTLANFIEHAALAHLAQENTVDDAEMAAILSDRELCRRLRRGMEDVERGRYRIVG
jgi:predicted transcriptional regulator